MKENQNFHFLFWWLYNFSFPVKHGADYNSCDIDGCMPIHVAAVLGHFDVIAYFVAKGQNVDVKDAKGRTPMMIGTGMIFLLTSYNTKNLFSTSAWEQYWGFEVIDQVGG